MERRIFLLLCEGQVGDMEFKRGNKAIKNHILDNYELHLFKNISNGYVKYMGKFVYEGYEIDEGYDTKGNLRKIIVFKLIPYEKYQNRL